MKPNEILEMINLPLNKYSAGIYMILCIPNNKAYIGHSKNIHKRWTQHKRYLKNLSHPNKYLQNCFNRYGVNNFSFLLIENTDDLNVREAFWLNLIDVDLRLNLTEIDTASGNIKFISKISSRKGVVLPIEQKLKMSESAKNRSLDSKMRISEARWTKKHRLELSKKKRKLTDSQVLEIKSKIELGNRKCHIEKEYSISESTFYRIKKGSYLK